MGLLSKIKDFEQSEKYRYFKYGIDYYTGDNTEIMKRRKCVFNEVSNSLLDVPYKANHKYPSGFFRIVVDQKVQYLLGNGVKAEDDVLEALDNATNGIYPFLIKSATAASQQGIQWAYMYVDGGALKFALVDPENVAPVYKYGKLNSVIYTFDEGDLSIAEVWDAEKMQRYEKKKTDTDFEMVSTHAHYTTIESFGGKKVSEQPHSFGMVPFVCLRNNQYSNSDLKDIKALIDIYDIISSDFANNIDDMQDAFFIIKNFGGESLSQFMSDLKQYKSIQVGDDGSVSAEQLEIPTEARKVFIEQLSKDIFKFAMAVDTTAISGGSITNVVIKAMFANLDLKCDKFEMEITDYLNAMLEAINLYYSTSLASDYTFDRSMIVNRTEVLTELPKQTDLSIRTRLEANPLVQDADEEIKRLAEEEAEQVKKLGGNMGFDDGEGN